MSALVVTLTALTALAWTTVEPGLELAEVTAPRASSHGDSRLSLVRIDPAYFELQLVMASEEGTPPRTVEQWARVKGLVVAVNAGMFDADGRTATFLMKSAGHTNNPKLGRENAVLAFDPVGEGPPVRILDRKCHDLPKLRRKYRTLVQGIRMADCNGRNKWSVQPKRWSTVAVATDDEGRVLFLFARSPYRVHDFVEMFLGLRLGIGSMMYLEGGPEATLVVRAEGHAVVRVGSYETGFNENDDNDTAWVVPNVLGVVRRP